MHNYVDVFSTCMWKGVDYMLSITDIDEEVEPPKAVPSLLSLGYKQRYAGCLIIACSFFVQWKLQNEFGCTGTTIAHFPQFHRSTDRKKKRKKKRGSNKPASSPLAPTKWEQDSIKCVMQLLMPIPTRQTFLHATTQ